MGKWAKRRDDPAHWPLTVHHVKECDGILEALDKMMEVRRATSYIYIYIDR